MLTKLIYYIPHVYYEEAIWPLAIVTKWSFEIPITILTFFIELSLVKSTKFPMTSLSIYLVFPQL